MFVSTAVALYGYDQGMMSLINTNYDYLETMGIAEDDPMVGMIVSVYYLGCAVGAVGFSRFADWKGRKNGIFFCLATASLGSFIMFFAGIGGSKGGLAVMLTGRVIMGLGVGKYKDPLTDFPSRWPRSCCSCLLVRNARR
jgi:MFS family permease